MDDMHTNGDASSSDQTAIDPQAALAAELEQVRRERDEYLAGWKRAQADYQNLQKDVTREKCEFVKYANERLLAELLPAVDQFALAMRYQPAADTLSEESRKTWENWLIGLRAVYASWERTAGTLGLERIPTNGAFDPLLHEAVGQESVEGQPPDTIVRVIEDGWRLNGKVLRPAKVIVAI